MFHCWDQVAYTVPFSSESDEQQSTTIKYVVGLVEFEDGSVERIMPNKIIFQDSLKLFCKVEKQISKWEGKHILANEPDDQYAVY